MPHTALRPHGQNPKPSHLRREQMKLICWIF
jgi:hypothetical protein